MLNLSDNALLVLERRYLARDEQGELLETPEGMFERVADAVAQADKLYDEGADTSAVRDEFYGRMTRLEFLPNSPTLMNAGRPLGQLSACFVLPIEDSMDGIFDAVKSAALIHKSGGGTGFSFSRLRPKGAAVRSTGGVASGPISFMKVFNTATEAVKQGGTRRGANMGILRVDHPDIEEFITCKQRDGEITNFNISIGLTEAFMDAVEKGGSYDLIDPHTRLSTGTRGARDVFNLIVEMAWKNGEPGIVFLDRINAANPVPHLGQVEATNPCGEQPLLPYESCNLASINLNACTDEKGIDYDKLGGIVDTAVHFLDNVIDINRYPLDVIRDMTLNTRKIGLGVMGFADMLFTLGIPYNSEEAVNTARKLMAFIDNRSKSASQALARARGAYPAFKGKGKPQRNATTTTIAPTGTISIIAGASSGIEPLFALAFVRNVMDNDALPEIHPMLERVARQRGFYSPELMRRVAAEGTLAHIEEIPADARAVFVTAHDIAPAYHVDMQAAFQTHTDNAVSKTVNFPNEATREDVADVFAMAYKKGLKGITIYRDGSRSMQVLSVGASKAPEASEAETPAAPNKRPIITPRPRPDKTRGITEKLRIGCGTIFITVNSDEEGICEVFTNLGRAGGCPSQSEATSRLVSIALRSGMDVNAVIDQLKGIRCHSTLRQKGLKVLSCPDAIGRVLERFARDGNGHSTVKLVKDEGEPDIAAINDNCGGNCSLCSMPCNKNDHVENPCPECGAALQYDGGCVVCRDCGYSKCN